jgi:DNA-binding MarR family transcriptional regulator
MDNKIAKQPRKRRQLFDVSNINMSLWVLLDQARDLVAKVRELELRHFKLTRAQASTLYILLFENKGLTIGDISNWNMREPNSVLSLVNRMEKIDLVKKTRSPEKDKIIINITDKGRKLYTGLTRQSIEMIFSALSNGERQQLKRCLIKVRAKSRELLGMDFKPPFLP